MSQRVDESEWVQFQWEYLLRFLGGERRVEQLAYETGAFTRRRKIEKPSDLLRLLLLWAVGERSLMETAALASEADLADVSDVALLKRFRRAEGWLSALLGELLIKGQSGPVSAYPIRLLDASCLSGRGSKGTDRRLHLSLDLRSNRAHALELTDWRGGERLDRFQFTPGEIAIADRAYATRKGLSHVAGQGAYFLVRLPWSNLPLETLEGESFNLLEVLGSLPEAQAGSFNVQFRSPEGQAIPARLVGIRKSEPAAQSTRQKITADARRHGNPTIDLRTMEAAGYVFVITNLPEEISAESVLQLYRLRWQIEMKFKTLKSVLHLGTLPTRAGALLNVYVMAKLLVALLIDDLIEKAGSFSPWGYPIAAPSPMASDAAPC